MHLELYRVELTIEILDANDPVIPRSQREPCFPLQSHGEHRESVVVGVFTEEIDPPWGSREQRRKAPIDGAERLSESLIPEVRCRVEHQSLKP